MKIKFRSRSAFFNSRAIVSLSLCAVGLLLAVAALSRSLTGTVRQETTTQSSSGANFPTAAQTESKLTYRIIDAPNHTWCYDVFADGRLMIHQTSVPALPGNEGFRTKEDATTVAVLVIEKIKRGEMPPTTPIDEMKRLNVIK
jgi:hypothetical protein